MASNIQEYWEVQKDGVWHSLHSYSQHLKSIFGARTDVPDLRGGNTSVYGLRGSLWNEKTPDERTLSFAGWLTALNEDGTKKANGVLAGVEENWRQLKNLLWREHGEQYLIRRTWKGPDGSNIQAVATAEFGGGMQMSDSYPMFARWSADVTLCDPFFYGAPISFTLGVGTPLTVVNPGDVTAFPTMTAHGQLTNPQIDHDGKWMRLGAAVANGDQVVIQSDPRVLTVVRQSDGANMVGSITRSGSREWMPLKPGENDLEMTVTAGTGTVDFTFQPGYL